MNDDELDSRLRDHGTAWRDANPMRPAPDWNAATAPHRGRGWLAVAAVAVAAAAITVPLVLTSGSRTPINPKPAAHTGKPVVAGAPHNFFALARGKVWEVYFSSAPGPLPAGSESSDNREPLGLAASSDAQTAYAALPAAGCSTKIQRHRLFASGASVRDIAVISGRAVSQPMALSPDGTRLALAVTTSRDGSASAACTGSERLVVINTATKRTRIWSAPKGDAIRNLAWSADGRHLAVLVAPACSFQSYSTAICFGASSGTRVLDTAAAGHNLISAPRIQSLLPSHGPDGDAYGPVFWWHGQWVTAYDGAIRAVSKAGGLGRALAAGLPSSGEVDSVSSTPSGEHLLLTDQGTTYRWDNGVLTRVKGEWAQPAW